MSKQFDNPYDFLEHLRSAAAAGKTLTPEERLDLLQACVAAFEQVLDNHDQVLQRFAVAVDALNAHHSSWGHKLSEVYRVMGAADITPEDMDQLLRTEVCGSKEP